jgi:hypothetical protein
MAKLSAEEKKILAKLKAKAEAPDAEDYEVRIRNADGTEAHLPASRAGSWVEQHFGIKLFDSDEEEGEEGDEEEGEEGDEEGEPSRSYFRGKRGKTQ